MKETVQNFIYKGGRHAHLGNLVAKLDPDRCAYQVTDHGRITDWHQCTRKFVEVIDEYGFCKTHAQEVKRRLGIKQESTVRFAANFSGEPYLARLSVVQETDKTIDIDDIETLIGNGVGGIYTGRTRKDSQWMRKFEFFDTTKEAHRWLLTRAEISVAFCKRELEKAEEVYNKLLRKGL